MNIAKKLPIVRIQNTLIHLDFLTTAYLDDNKSYSGHWVIGYHVAYSDLTFEIAFPKKVQAMTALADLLAAVDIPIIEESE